MPDSLRGARLTGPRAAAAGLLIVLVVAAVAFGARVALARAASVPQVVAPAGPGSAVVQRGATGTAFASSTTASGGGGPPSAARVTVHVVGQVAKPGVVELAAGARVADAVARAGGAVKGADLSAVNLARVLTDGEQIRVPKPGEVLAPAPGAPGAGTGSGSAGAPGGVAGAKVNLNRASGAELEELPGVGPVLAQRIIDWRTEHGRFSSIDELGEVSGIGEKIFAQLAPKVTV